MKLVVNCLLTLFSMNAPRDIQMHAGVLHALAKAKPSVLKRQIQLLPSPVIKTLKRLSKNYLKGNIVLSPSQLKKVRRHKDVLRKLAKSKTSLKQSRSLLQRGGFISSLLLPLIGLFGSLFAKKK